MGRRSRRAQAEGTKGAPAARLAVPHPQSDPNAWTTKDTRYWPVVGMMLALGAALRLLWLDRFIFQHDESIYTLHSHNFRDYNFDPTYHGPTLYHVIKVFLLAFGDSDFTARMVSVVMGFAAMALILGPARRWLGDRAALFALGLHAISPALVTYQRRILFDAFVVVLTFGAVLLAQKLRTVQAGSWRWIGTWVGLVSLLTVFLATKANSFFVIAMLLSFAAAIALRGVGPRDLGVRLPPQLPLLMLGAVTLASIVWAQRYPEDMALTQRHEHFLQAVCVAASAFLWEWLRRTGREPRAEAGAGVPVLRLALCVALCAVAGGLLYFFFFGHGYLWLTAPGEWSWSRYWPDVRDAMKKMLDYWGGQQKAPRLPGRHDFYLPLMIAYELPILVAFVGGVVRASRHRAPFTDLLLWWSFTSWTLYAMANEKVPWLMTHLSAPFVLLGGWWLAQIRPRGPMQARAFAVLGVLGAAFLLRNVSATNYERAVDNREPMFYAFQPESFGDTLFHAIEVTRDKPGDLWIYNAWPPSWYMRRAPERYGAVAHYQLQPGQDPPAVPLRVVFCTEPEWERYRTEDRFRGWKTWTWDPKAARPVDDGTGANPHFLNWPRLSWYSLRPDLFLAWFFERRADLPFHPPPEDHSLSTNTAFLTEWSHHAVVVATPP